MFTGIVEKTGVLDRVSDGRLVIAHPWSAADLKLGQSIAVNGCCLTVVEFDDRDVQFDVSTETLNRTTFSTLKPGNEVNLERPVRVGGTLDGHWVTGHIDSTALVRRAETAEDGTKMLWIDPAKPHRSWIVEKGSVALDGVSLTINNVDSRGFSIALVPHTLKLTTLRNLKVGDFVNLEYDILAKYVERLFGDLGKTETRKRSDEARPQAR